MWQTFFFYAHHASAVRVREGRMESPPPPEIITEVSTCLSLLSMTYTPARLLPSLLPSLTPLPVHPSFSPRTSILSHYVYTLLLQTPNLTGTAKYDEKLLPHQDFVQLLSDFNLMGKIKYAPLCTALYCTVLYCTAVNCSVQYCAH